MLINNVDIVNSRTNPSQIEIKGSIISAVRLQDEFSGNPSEEIIFNFSEAIAFPGLINSHDHLEFNLFPKLGNKVYKDYVEWGEDIHKQNHEEIERIKKIPYELRFKWGLYKNLICGVTTVAHHGNGKVFRIDDLPEIISNYNYLHSIRLERNWKLKLNLIFNKMPFVIHLGEGTNFESSKEINEFIMWNFFRKKITGVHCIAFNNNQSRILKALVWCPDSNLFLYNKTTDIISLKNKTDILFGTDSTLSSDWNIWNHLRLARKLNYLDDEELFSTLTDNAARIWGIDSKGSIEAHKTADLVICKKKSKEMWNSFYSVNPEDILLIIKNGKIVLIDFEIAGGQPAINKNDFDQACINSSKKFIVKGLAQLIHSIKNYAADYEFPISIL